MRQRRTDRRRQAEAHRQMSSKELMTCRQYGLAIKPEQQPARHGAPAADLYHGRRRSHIYMEARPDFVKQAEAYGHRGLRIVSDDALGPALREAFAERERLVFLDVLVDRRKNVYPTLPPDRPLTDMILRTPIAAEDL